MSITNDPRNIQSDQTDLPALKKRLCYSLVASVVTHPKHVDKIVQSGASKLLYNACERLPSWKEIAAKSFPNACKREMINSTQWAPEQWKDYVLVQIKRNKARRNLANYIKKVASKGVRLESGIIIAKNVKNQFLICPEVNALNHPIKKWQHIHFQKPTDHDLADERLYIVDDDVFSANCDYVYRYPITYAYKQAIQAGNNDGPIEVAPNLIYSLTEFKKNLEGSHAYNTPQNLLISGDWMLLVGPSANYYSKSYPQVLMQCNLKVPTDIRVQTLWQLENAMAIDGGFLLTTSSSFPVKSFSIKYWACGQQKTESLTGEYLWKPKIFKHPDSRKAFVHTNSQNSVLNPAKWGLPDPHFLSKNLGALIDPLEPIAISDHEIVFFGKTYFVTINLKTKKCLTWLEENSWKIVGIKPSVAGELILTSSHVKNSRLKCTPIRPSKLSGWATEPPYNIDQIQEMRNDSGYFSHYTFRVVPHISPPIPKWYQELTSDPVIDYHQIRLQILGQLIANTHPSIHSNVQ